ncbi:MAG TPA: acyl carrier protein [Solirubrobacteraceae bacterium]|jgi:acyl carrier protein|nr:acyl carrier protein [Solirubrobacteraceae bacterium]
MYESLKHILAEILGCASEEIPDDAQLTMLDGWDSLRHLELMLELEAEFDIHIQAKEIRELASLEQINDYIHARIPGQAPQDS